MKKVALFVFNGDPMCFVHVLLNALDMNAKGYEAKIIIEGAATKLVPDLAKTYNPLHALWEQAKSENLVAGVCKACSSKLGSQEAATGQSLKLLDGMSGHPAMAYYQEAGYDIISF